MNKLIAKILYLIGLKPKESEFYDMIMLGYRKKDGNGFFQFPLKNKFKILWYD